jgi:ubiquinone/menaquinone biosynthesis C-methylase UbiE
MPTDPPANESTYVLDNESAAEMARLMHQDRLLTKGMGGLFSELGDVSHLHDILDIACGPGGWVLDVAYQYPKMNVVGVDVSRIIIEYAKAQAWSQGLENASFRIMNVLNGLDFPDNSFDLVNARLLLGFMPPTAWPGLLQECLRITRPGGLIRLTECEKLLTNNFALEKISSMLTQAMQKAGQSFSPDGGNIGITPMLGGLLSDAGYHNIQERAHAFNGSAGMEAYQSFYQNFQIAYKLAEPFLIKMKMTTKEEFDELYNQAMAEAMLDNFRAIWYYLTVWGEKAASQAPPG